MKIERLEAPEGEAKLLIEATVEETDKALSKVLVKWQRNVRIPGFRPGKAPLSMIRKRFGMEVMEEKSKDVVQELLGAAFEEAKIMPGGQIDLVIKESGLGEGFTFEVSFPIQPEVKMSQYKGLRITINYAEVTDEDVEREIEAHKRQQAIMRSIDTPAPVEAKLALTVQEVDPSGLPLIGCEVKEIDVFEFGLDMLGVGTDEQLIGISAGEKRLVSARMAGGLVNRQVKSKIIKPGEPADSWDSGEIYLSVQAQRVEIPEIPPLDDDLAKKINQRVETVDELKKWVKLNLLSLVAYHATRQLEKNLITKLIDENPFTISSALIGDLLRETEEMNKLDKGEAAKYMDENREEIERDYRWVLIREKIAELENIEISDQEVTEELRRIAEETGKTLAQVRYSFEENKALGRLRSRMFERRVIGFLNKHAEVEKREMSLDEFVRIARQADRE